MRNLDHADEQLLKYKLQREMQAAADIQGRDWRQLSIWLTGNPTPIVLRYESYDRARAIYEYISDRLNNNSMAVGSPLEDDQGQIAGFRFSLVYALTISSGDNTQ